MDWTDIAEIKYTSNGQPRTYIRANFQRSYVIWPGTQELYDSRDASKNVLGGGGKGRGWKHAPDAPPFGRWCAACLIDRQLCRTVLCAGS